MSGLLSKITRNSIGQTTSLLRNLERNPQCTKGMSNWSSKKTFLGFTPKQTLPWIGYTAIGSLALYALNESGAIGFNFKEIKALSSEKFSKMRKELSAFTNFFATCEESNLGTMESLCMMSMDKEDETIRKANAELEKALMDIKKKAMCSSQLALTTVCDVVDITKIFMEAVNCAAEDFETKSPEFEASWCTVQEYCGKRCILYQKAAPKVQEAWEHLCQLREVIERGKRCKYTCSNPLLKIAEETLCCAEYELTSGKAHLECVMQESRLVEQYRNLLEGFRRDLKAEKEALIGICDCPRTLSENELMMVLTHAFKKLARIQAELNLAGNQCDNSLSGVCGIEGLRVRPSTSQSAIDAEDSKCTCEGYREENDNCNTRTGCQDDYDFSHQSDCSNQNECNKPQQAQQCAEEPKCAPPPEESCKSWFSSVFLSEPSAPVKVGDCSQTQQPAVQECYQPPLIPITVEECNNYVEQKIDFGCPAFTFNDCNANETQRDCSSVLDDVCKKDNKCGNSDNESSDLCDAPRCQGCPVCELDCECFTERERAKRST